MANYFVNQQLDGREFELISDNPACVLLTHGFTATTVEVAPFAQKLFEAGYDVVAPLLPGHNTSPFDLNKKEHSDWTDYMEFKLKKVCSQYGTIFVAGESMGGLLSCYLAERYPQITGLLLFAPALSVKKLSLLSVLRFIKPFIGQPDESESKKKEPDEDNQYSFPWKGYNVKPTAAGFELYRLQKIVRKDLKKIKQPTLIFQGMLDKTIDITSSEIIHQHISSPHKELIYLENSAHCIILDEEFDYVVEKSLQFFASLCNQKSN